MYLLKSPTHYIFGKPNNNCNDAILEVFISLVHVYLALAINRADIFQVYQLCFRFQKEN